MSKVSVLVCALFMVCCIASSESKPYGGRWDGYRQSPKGHWGGYHRGFGDYYVNTHQYYGNRDVSRFSGEDYNTQYKRPFGGYRPNWHTHNDECEHNSFGYKESGDEDVENTNKTSDEDIRNNEGGENIDTGNTSYGDVSSNSGDENYDSRKTSDEDVSSNGGGENMDTGNVSDENDNTNTGNENIDGLKADATTVKGTMQGSGETTEYPHKIDIRFGVSDDGK